MQLRKQVHPAEVTAVPATPVQGSSPTITFAADGCVMGYVQNVLITIWAGQQTVPLIGHFGTLAEILTARYPKTSAAHVLLPTASMPTGEARKALEELSDRYESRVACVATMITGSGFWPSAMRGLVTSLQVVQRKPFKANTFATVGPLAVWLDAQNEAETAVSCGAITLEKALSSMLKHPTLVRGTPDQPFGALD